MKEKAPFYIDPSNKLALPGFHCQADSLETYCNLQILLGPPDHPLFNAKCSFLDLFKHALSGIKYFTLSFPSRRVIGSRDVYALLCVYDVQFSIAFATPVLDVSYCFLDTKQGISFLKLPQCRTFIII